MAPWSSAAPGACGHARCRTTDQEKQDEAALASVRSLRGDAANPNGDRSVPVSVRCGRYT